MHKAFCCGLFLVLVLLSRGVEDWKPPCFAAEGVRDPHLASLSVACREKGWWDSLPTRKRPRGSCETGLITPSLYWVWVWGVFWGKGAVFLVPDIGMPPIPRFLRARWLFVRCLPHLAVVGGSLHRFIAFSVWHVAAAGWQARLWGSWGEVNPCRCALAEILAGL